MTYATNEPLISVIIPAYNAEMYIENCLQSLLFQTYGKWEAVIIDDGSQDRTFQKCDAFAGKDSRFRLIKQNNRGVSAARNAGIDRARGEYILFLDADDELDCRALEELASAAAGNTADIIIFGFQYIYNDHTEICLPPVMSGTISSGNVYNDFWKWYQSGVLHNVGTKLYRSALLRTGNILFSEDKPVLEDISFCINAIDHACRLQIMDKDFYHYRIQSNAQSAQKRYRAGYFEYLKDLFDLALYRGAPEDKQCCLIFMDAILLVLRNEIYNTQERKNKIRQYRKICADPDVKRRVSGIQRQDVRLIKYLFYKMIQMQKCGTLLVAVRLWDSMTARL